MASKLHLAAAAALVLLAPFRLAMADSDENDAARLTCSYCEFDLRMETAVTFDRVYTANYRNGESYDFVTVRPDGGGESFAEVGIRIRVRFLCDRYTPGEIIRAGVPQDFVLWSPDVCMCVPKAADTGPDADGWVEWSGTLAAGGCAQELDVYIAVPDIEAALARARPGKAWHRRAVERHLSTATFIVRLKPTAFKHTR